MVQSQEEEAGSQAFDVILYLFVLGPAVEWCLKSPRVNRGQPGSMRGMALAIALLAALALGKLAYDMAGRDANHFEQLGVRVDASAAEIRKAHKALSLSLHPDKAPDDPRAKEKFLKMQAAYEVLKDASSRDAYNKFGAAGIEDAKSGGNSNSLTSMALFYVIWLVVGYLLTMGKSSEDARTWGFSGLLALAVFEYQTRMLGVDYLASIFPRSTVHEKVELLHKLFPPFLHGARMISASSSATSPSTTRCSSSSCCASRPRSSTSPARCARSSTRSSAAAAAEEQAAAAAATAAPRARWWAAPTARSPRRPPPPGRRRRRRRRRRRAGRRPPPTPPRRRPTADDEHRLVLRRVRLLQVRLREGDLVVRGSARRDSE